MSTLSNVTTRRGEHNPPSTSFTADAIPEAKSSKTGVSVEFAPDPTKCWYVFRASYGREDRAYDFLVEDGTYAYIAKRSVDKFIHGKRKHTLENLIPNLLFAYTTAEQAEVYIRNTPELSFLTYYYNLFKFNEEQKNPPLTIPSREMENFIRATCSQNEHLRLVEPQQCHYKGGDLVVVTEGVFKGVEGRVARVAGQQRVIVTLSEVGLISTAYIPTAFIMKLEDNHES